MGNLTWEAREDFANEVILVSLKEEIRIHMLDQESFQVEGTVCAKELKFEAHSALGELPVQEGE